ncbi:hypothetical protein [Paenibacillus sp. KN14-4R]|uniref:hypothetical protein n=1 Tax=Paenibacillus sp. KN14-4R TaxID=3445773 RepID=UPI003FA08622
METSFNISKFLIPKIDIILEKIPYISDNIIGISYEKEERVVKLKLKSADMNKYNELRSNFEDLCSSLEQTRIIKKRVLKNNLTVEDCGTVNVQLENDHEHFEYMDERDIVLIDQIDREFVNIAKKNGAELRDYPSVLNKKNMIRNQYHVNFPQNILGISSVPHNYQSIKDFRGNAEKNCYEKSLSNHGEFLQPCICYHCYEEFQEKKVTNKIITGKGKCFRQEVEWRKDNFRKNEFLMREIVFIGQKDWVINMRNEIMEQVWCFFESIGLKGKVITATDPFFFSHDIHTKGTFQMISNSKYELVVRTMSGKEISIASFNYCQDLLCTKYEITDEKNIPLYSGCVAFGLDRWKEVIKENRDYKQNN